ncbi:hypothetical protein B0F87_103258 [Methylobacter tundripaludum]|uniref:Uncharacterized protein n=1 Tax=Methylobacter tundripaludum TaxID=173365 RepID=A0A2S6HGZ4_9GAMM|nr:hypothetical protein B0F87_103258 [Methylobacter tundripaludum]
MTKRNWNHRLICMDTLLGRTRTDNATTDLCNAEYAVRTFTYECIATPSYSIAEASKSPDSTVSWALLLQSDIGIYTSTAPFFLEGEDWNEGPDAPCPVYARRWS